MNWYLVRVELHGAEDDPDAYDTLHTEMQARKFVRKIQANTKGAKWYKLPTAEYFISSILLTTNQVHSLAKEAANKTKRSSWVIAVRFDEAVFTLEEKPSTLLRVKK